MSVQKEIAAIHVLKHKAGMDEETYRAMLRSIGGAASSKDLSPLGRAKVLHHLRGLVGPQGYQGRPKTIDMPGPGAGRLLKKIEALLADAHRPWGYALVLCKRIAKKDRLEFCSETELTKLIAALSIDARRRATRQEQPPC